MGHPLTLPTEVPGPIVELAMSRSTAPLEAVTRCPLWLLCPSFRAAGQRPTLHDAFVTESVQVSDQGARCGGESWAAG